MKTERNLNMSIIALGGIVLQTVINEAGFDYIAAFAATNKMILIYEGIAIALGSALTTYVGQNFGAGRAHRQDRHGSCAGATHRVSGTLRCGDSCLHTSGHVPGCAVLYHLQKERKTVRKNLRSRRFCVIIKIDILSILILLKKRGN